MEFDLVCIYDLFWKLQPIFVECKNTSLVIQIIISLYENMFVAS